VTDTAGRQGYDAETEPKRPEASLGELVGELTSGMSSLFRQELQLAKLEAREEAKRFGTGAGMLAGAAVAGLLALMLLSWALAWLLDQALNTALSFAIVGLLWVIVAAVMLKTGRSKLKTVEPLPETQESIKEDVAWAKAQKS